MDLEKEIGPKPSELRDLLKNNPDKVAKKQTINGSKNKNGVTIAYRLEYAGILNDGRPNNGTTRWDYKRTITVNNTYKPNRNLVYETKKTPDENQQNSTLNDLSNIGMSLVAENNQGTFQYLFDGETICDDAGYREEEHACHSDILDVGGVITRSGDIYYSYLGYVDVSYSQKLDNSQSIDLNKFAENIVFTRGDMDKWGFNVTGSIDYKFRLVMTPSETKRTNMSICPNKCQITYLEVQDIKGATLKPGFSNYLGKIDSYIRHEETYSGHMTYDQTKKTLRWSDDLTVIKTDDRTIKYDMQSRDETGFVNAKWKYEKIIDSDATLNPVKNNYSGIKDHRTETLVIDKFWPACTGCSDTVSSKATITNDITERNISTNTGSTITREGTGNYEINNPQSDVEHRYQLPRYKQYSGVYDNDNTEIKITSASVRDYQMTDPDTGSDLIGTRANPIKEGDADGTMTQDRMPALKVMGEFNIETGNVAVMKSPQFKTTPSNIYVFMSYNRNDPTFVNLDYETLTSGSRGYMKIETGTNGTIHDHFSLNAVKATLDQVRAVHPNVNIQYVSTRTKKDFLSAVENLPNGAWVINIGHGDAQGNLMLNYLAWGTDPYFQYSRWYKQTHNVMFDDNEPEYGTTNSLRIYPDNDLYPFQTVNMYEITSTLAKKNIKIDVFAGDTCYSARMPIADIVIGSVGLGYHDDYGQTIGGLFGVAGNSFNQTTSGVLSAISEAAKIVLKPGSTAQISPTTTPSGTLDY